MAKAIRFMGLRLRNFSDGGSSIAGNSLGWAMASHSRRTPSETNLLGNSHWFEVHLPHHLISYASTFHIRALASLRLLLSFSML